MPVDYDGKHYEIGFMDLCMSYDWKCYLNDHIVMLMPKSRWHNLQGQLAEFAKDIIEQEVGNQLMNSHQKLDFAHN